MSKKQNSISLSPLLRLNTLLLVIVAPNFFGCKNFFLIMVFVKNYLTIYCDNTNAINISKNHVQHSQTKHIVIRHYFICDLVEDGTFTLEFIYTDD